MFTPVRHSFALQDVLMFELFQRTYLILFYFHLNQLRNIPAKTYLSGKKRNGLSQRQEGNTLFSGPENELAAI